MGVLYLAVKPGLERRVALKLIAPEAAADEVFARRFAEESKIAASIEYPNVVPIYAAEEGVPAIQKRPPPLPRPPSRAKEIIIDAPVGGKRRRSDIRRRQHRDQTDSGNAFAVRA